MVWSMMLLSSPATEWWRKHKPGFHPLVKASSPSPSPRRLILLRHAKACSLSLALRDHDLPLSKDGETDVVKVAHKLQRLRWIPQLILSSDATRSRQTLKIMQDQVQAFSEAEVHFISSFYSVAAMDGQTADHLRRAICKYATDDILTVMCMGHNRGWEEAASTFSGASVELKTCNAALLEAANHYIAGISFGGRWWLEAPAISQAKCGLIFKVNTYSNNSTCNPCFVTCI